ncbi:uncharacterized protein LOC130743613 [Lotus japonicus]|uniref:uncharacterized protein LOC130743613 n=1 Tax=Lotus japonicus TaxID=34305 RepID=UPI0025871E32|nr:uncharacterized protein LOC130743613 [Lotus japonicus]
MRFIITLTYILLLLPYKLSIAADDSIHLSQSITDGQTLVSQDETFELGFFRPDGNSNRTYLGIWFKNIPVRQVVWVANRVKPITGSDNIMLTVNSTGNLVLTQNSTVVWFTNIQKQAHTNPVAVLLDNGNLVVRNEGETNQEEHLWQSFDYPSDTWLPDMKLGRSFKSGHDIDRKLTSWKSPQDPSPSEFSCPLLLHDYPEYYIMKGTNIKLSRFGPWNGEYISGIPEVRYTTSSSTDLSKHKQVFLFVPLWWCIKGSKVRLSSDDEMRLFLRKDDPSDWERLLRAWRGTRRVLVPFDEEAFETFGVTNADSDERDLDFFGKGSVKRPNEFETHCYHLSLERDETSQLAEIDLPLFDLTTIAAATNGFSMNKKIGEGGFGPVYWGKLTNGQEIAVKKLSRLSSQGMTEFITEVKLIAQLQHRNLVKLLGCCIQGQERVLIYEYMNNGSLHSFIFDDIKGKLLQWPQRLHIICGICRGLVYLHQDSRLRIIHRDLKASNILLDQDLNPKISDFGTARTFGGDQTEGNTKRIIGTYGYMAPEYVSKGIFSVKSDVFSFGVLLLEIICGKRNKAYYHTDDNLNLVGQAWTLWKEGIASELIDSNIGDSYVVSEVLRCMHVSLLCVQQNPNDRPTMTSAMLMLESEMALEEPKEPGFFYSNISPDSYLRSSRKDRSLAYDVTISSFGPR